MSLNTNEVFVLSKENIQPLRRGRKAAHLKTALQAHMDLETQQLLHRQREQFELMIRMYEGDDPLEPYYKYVIWLEQSFAKLGRECNLILLLEDTLIKFKDCTKYKQDPRLVQMVIKYINVQSNPLELYQVVYKQGLGTMCSIFYKAWAEELDKNFEFKRADQVFQLGINCRAQPLNELRDAHIQFQLSIARRMLEGNMNEVTSSDGTQRAAFSRFPSKMSVSRANKNTAGVFQSTSIKLTLRNCNADMPKFNICDEDVVDECMKSDFKNKPDKLSKDSLADRENVMKTGGWCNQKQKQRSVNKASHLPTPSFRIHEDLEVACGQMKSILRPLALKTRKEELNCPIAVFEPPDPTKKPMYPKHLVYVGGCDIQLEEIYAAYYWKMKKLESEDENVEPPNAAMGVCEEAINLTKSYDTSIEQKSDSFAQVTTRSVLPEEHDFSPNVNTFTTSRSSKMSLCTINVSHHDQSKLSTKFIMPTPVAVPGQTISKQTEYVSNRNQVSSENCISENIVESTPSISKNINSEIKETFGLDVRRKSSTIFRENFIGEYSTTYRCSNLENMLKIHQIEDNLPDYRFSDRDDKVSTFFHHSPSTSITINTRTAMNVIQKMWESPLAPQTQKHEKHFNSFGDAMSEMSQAHVSPNCFEDENVNLANNFKPPIPFSDISDVSFREAKKAYNELCFSIYGDENVDTDLSTRIASAKSDKCSFPIHNKEPSNSVNELLDVPFTQPKIISRYRANDEEELAKPMDFLRMSENENNGPGTALPFIIPVNLQDTPLESENKENRPPKDYSTPSERRPLSGILTPAIDVLVQEIDSEEDEHDNEEFSIYDKRNEVDDDTCSTKAFAITLPSSTPFARPESSRSPRKSLLYDGSFICEDNYTTRPIRKAPAPRQTYENFKKINHEKTVNLSLILENSKEQGSSSSGRSANMASRHVS